jgi:hypothetical protein
MKVYLAYARLCYGLVVIGSAIAALYLILNVLGRLATWSAMSWLFAAACCLSFLFPSGRAVARKLRGGVLLSQPVGQNQGANFFLVTLLGSIGHACTALICYAYYIVVTRVDEMPNPIVFVIALAALCYLAALWVGEFALTRVSNEGRARAPR